MESQETNRPAGEAQEPATDGQLIQFLQTRLDRLESRNRLLTLALLALVGLVALAFGCAASSTRVQDVVKAKAFELVDDDGMTRVELSTRVDSGPGLYFHDAGETALRAAIVQEGLAFTGADGGPAVILSVSPDGRAGLGFYDDSGKRVSLSLGPSGYCGLELADSAGQDRVTLGLLLAGMAPGLHLCDANGNIRVFLVVDPDTPWLALADEKGHPLFSAP